MRGSRGAVVSRPAQLELRYSSGVGLLTVVTTEVESVDAGHNLGYLVSILLSPNSFPNSVNEPSALQVVKWAQCSRVLPLAPMN